MAQKNSSGAKQENPFESSVVRLGITLFSVVATAGIGFFFFEGVMRLALFGIAAVEAIVYPWILKKGAQANAQTESAIK